MDIKIFNNPDNNIIKEFTNNSKYVEYNYKLNTNNKETKIIIKNLIGNKKQDNIKIKNLINTINDNDDKNLKSIKRIIINTL